MMCSGTCPSLGRDAGAIHTFSHPPIAWCYTFGMRRIAVALVVLLAACSESSGGDGVCEEPTQVSRPAGDFGIWQGDESHCIMASLCYSRGNCAPGDEACADLCFEEVFGADDCGCCGEECMAACDEIRELITADVPCGFPGAGPDCVEPTDRCNDLSLPGDRTVVDP